MRTVLHAVTKSAPSSLRRCREFRYVELRSWTHFEMQVESPHCQLCVWSVAQDCFYRKWWQPDGWSGLDILETSERFWLFSHSKAWSHVSFPFIQFAFIDKEYIQRHHSLQHFECFALHFRAINIWLKWLRHIRPRKSADSDFYSNQRLRPSWKWFQRLKSPLQACHSLHLAVSLNRSAMYPLSKRSTLRS